MKLLCLEVNCKINLIALEFHRLSVTTSHYFIPTFNSVENYVLIFVLSLCNSFGLCVKFLFLTNLIYVISLVNLLHNCDLVTIRKYCFVYFCNKLLNFLFNICVYSAIYQICEIFTFLCNNYVKKMLQTCKIELAVY